MRARGWARASWAMSSAAACCCTWSTARRTTSSAPIARCAASSKAYGGKLARKKEIVALNKTDAMTAEDIEAKRALLAKASRKAVHVISGVSGHGVQPLLHELMKLRRQAARPRREGSRVTPAGGGRAGWSSRSAPPCWSTRHGRDPARLAGKPGRRVARLHKGGCEVVLVSSGAIRLGRTQSQAAAPARSSSRKARPPPPPARSGWPMPTRRRWRGTASPSAQVLLTLDDTEDRRRYLNARQTMGTLLGMRPCR